MKPLVSMRAALGDDDLLGKALKGESWSAWRTMLIAAMGEPLLDDERQVFAELTGGREREPGEPVEEFHAVVGRRSGKTKAAATAAVYLAALCDHSGQLAAGERAVLPLLSATTWQASRAFNLIRGVFMGAPALAGLIEGETAGELRLRNAVDILCRPASFRTIRGATAIGFVADEVGFWYSAEQARNPDTEIFNAMRPALATLGGPLLVVSSPYAKRGELWNAFKRDYGFDGDPKIVVINASSRRMNPTLERERGGPRLRARRDGCGVRIWRYVQNRHYPAFSTLRWWTRRLTVVFWFGLLSPTSTIARPVIHRAGRMTASPWRSATTMARRRCWTAWLRRARRSIRPAWWRTWPRRWLLIG